MLLLLHFANVFHFPDLFFQINQTFRHSWCARWNHFYAPSHILHYDIIYYFHYKCLTSPFSFAMDLTSLRWSSVSSMPYSSHMTMYSSSDIVPSPPVSVLSNNSHNAAKYNPCQCSLCLKMPAYPCVVSGCGYSWQWQTPWWMEPSCWSRATASTALPAHLLLHNQSNVIASFPISILTTLDHW